jgi:transcriptional regulator with XRE-family HTH domain
MSNPINKANSIRKRPGAQVTALLQQAGATQQEIADAAGCSQALVHRAIYGYGKATWRTERVWTEIAKRLAKVPA